MISSMLIAMALAGGKPLPPALTVMFPDQVNPSFYHAMTCRGAVRQGTRFHVGKDGAPAPKSGAIVFRCEGPITTDIEHSAFEPAYFHDTDWSWSFEAADGKEVMSGHGAKIMRPPAKGLRLYVREGYLDP